MLAPIWDEAADKIEAEFPEPGRVKIGKVDCDSESNFITVSKFLFHYLINSTVDPLWLGIILFCSKFT
jgi:hypothetical protein